MLLQLSLSSLYPQTRPPQSNLTRSPRRVTPYLLQVQELDEEDGGSESEESEEGEEKPEPLDETLEPTLEAGLTLRNFMREAASSLSQISSTATGDRL